MCKLFVIEKLIITECMAGYYGKDCLKQCSTSCASSCNRISGHCDHGCKPGWAGNACNKKISIYIHIPHKDRVDCCLPTIITPNAKKTQYIVANIITMLKLSNGFISRSSNPSVSQKYYFFYLDTCQVFFRKMHL